MSTADQVSDLVTPLLAASGTEVVDVELAGTVLTITIDRTGGLGLDALAAATRAVSRCLDEHDPIDGSYTLEVSSPGLERKLRRPDHFRRAVGEQITVKTVPGTEGERRVTGLLTQADDDGVVVAPAGGGTDRRLAYEEIERARTVFDWGPAPKPGKAKPGAAKPGKAKPGRAARRDARRTDPTTRKKAARP